MPRRSATWRATVALEKKMALQFKQSAQRRRTQRLRQKWVGHPSENLHYHGECYRSFVEGSCL